MFLFRVICWLVTLKASITKMDSIEENKKLTDDQCKKSMHSITTDFSMSTIFSAFDVFKWIIKLQNRMVSLSWVVRSLIVFTASNALPLSLALSWAAEKKVKFYLVVLFGVRLTFNKSTMSFMSPGMKSQLTFLLV